MVVPKSRDHHADSKVSLLQDEEVWEPLPSARGDQPEWMLPDPLRPENLRVIFRQERSEDYETSDYLGLSSRKRKRKHTRIWHMDACNRWEIGEWCYGGTLQVDSFV